MGFTFQNIHKSIELWKTDLEVEYHTELEMIVFTMCTVQYTSKYVYSVYLEFNEYTFSHQPKFLFPLQSKFDREIPLTD